MKTLIRGIVFGFSIVTTAIMLLALLGGASLFLIIGLIRYINQEEMDGLNAKYRK